MSAAHWLRALLRQPGRQGLAARWVLALLCAVAALQLLEWRRQVRRLRSIQQGLVIGRAIAVGKARRFLRAKLNTVAALTQQQLERQLEGALDGFATRLGARLKDPAMPAAVQRALDALVASLLPDVKQECWRWTDERFLPLTKLETPGYRRDVLSPLVPPATPPAWVTPSSRLRGEGSGSGTARVAAAGYSTVPPCTPVRRLLPAFSPGPPEAPHSPLNHPSPPPSSPQPASRRRPVACDALLFSLRRWRAAVLYTLWPCDRSIWMSFRTPWWWVLQALGHMPVLGQIWWLLLALLVDRRDEYQLCAFVVGLRVSHFVGLGLGAAAYACVQAYRCTFAVMARAGGAEACAELASAAALGAGWAGELAAPALDGGRACVELAPRLHVWGAAFWLLQIGVTIYAVALLLPRSAKKGARVPLERRHRLRRQRTAADSAPAASTPCLAAAEPLGDGAGGSGGGRGTRGGGLDGALSPGPLGSPSPDGSAATPADLLRGGLLPRLGRLDAGLALIAVAAALLACVLLRGSHQLSATLFWIRTVHGLLSCPYIAFKLPLLDTLLTHARKTGYDRLGHTVPFRVVAPQPQPPRVQVRPPPGWGGGRRLFGRWELLAKLLSLRVW